MENNCYVRIRKSPKTTLIGSAWIIRHSHGEVEELMFFSTFEAALSVLNRGHI